MNEWPSKNIPRGGIFHVQKPVYSQETCDLLRILIKEQRLSILQRSKIEAHLRAGSSLPPLNQSASKLKPPKFRPNVDLLRARTAKRRPFHLIKASGALDVEKYIPQPSTKESWEKQKIRLQAEMSGIEEIEEDDIGDFENNNAQNEDKVIDPIDELLKEIEERATWLNDMIALGEGKKHKQQVMNEIAERLTLIKQIEMQQNRK